MLVSASAPSGFEELFTTPIRVSSTLSYGPWLGSPSTEEPVSVMTTSRPQLVSAPTVGHSVNGGLVGADAVVVAVADVVAGCAVEVVRGVRLVGPWLPSV